MVGASPDEQTMEPGKFEETDVVICGCGPTGAILAAYLGRLGIPHIVVEKEPEITTDPRGIALDEDGIRMLQGIGIYDAIYSEIGTCERITDASLTLLNILRGRYA